MARFQRGYPRNIYIRKGPGPTGGGPLAGSVVQRNSGYWRKVTSRTVIGPRSRAAGGIASTNITPPQPPVVGFTRGISMWR
jgi:hypothetical protein